MLQAFDLAYSPDPRVGNLFSGLSLSVSPGERVVLLGRNGTGKTKLLEILAGIVVPDEGRVVVDFSDRIGYLPQDIDAGFVGTLTEYLLQDTDAEPAALARLAKLCSRMAVTQSQLEQPYDTLSIGERTRAGLARLQMGEPTILLLDEPTNNLDVAAREWLEQFLLQSRAGVLMVCHDRAVIDAVADRVLELTPGGLTEYGGGYSQMRREQETARENQAALHERQTKEERRLKELSQKVAAASEKMAKRPTRRTYDPKAKAFYRGKQAKLARRASGIRTRAEQVSESKVEKPFEEVLASIEFPARPLRYADALTLRNLELSFGERRLFDGFNLTLQSGEKLALVGSNGVGKTTLFRVLLGELEPEQGEVVWSPDAKPMLLSQARTHLNRDDTILQALGACTRDQETKARLLLGCLRISGDAVHKPLSVLSVGERTKVEIAAMLLTEANVLMLDEPTNHLDIDSLEALEDALREFPGSILFTSHDRAFIERLADTVVEL